LPEEVRYHLDITRARDENWDKDGTLYFKKVKPGKQSQ
jgi:hypothetical protein